MYFVRYCLCTIRYNVIVCISALHFFFIYRKSALLDELIRNARCAKGETISTIPHICVLRLIDIVFSNY